MYIAFSQVVASLKRLEALHPFFGISFLVCKKNNIPVGSTTVISLDAEERAFLENFYKPPIDTAYYLRVFRTSDKSKFWLDPKYPAAGSQSTRTRGELAEAFIHVPNSNSWGWKDNYLDILKTQVIIKNKGKLLPAYDLAIWLYREKELPADTNPSVLTSLFFEEFNITEQEQEVLFSKELPLKNDFLSESKISWEDLLSIFGNPPDFVSSGGILTYLELRSVGPSKSIVIEPARRLSVITGDNGLGKTFLLDCAWWALTGQWSGYPALPFPEAKEKDPRIIFQISMEAGRAEKIEVPYNWELQSWPAREKQPTLPGLIIYARVDGSFAVWDPASFNAQSGDDPNVRSIQGYLFNSNNVWDGLERKGYGGKSQVICNGLLRDWISWQNKRGKSPFDILTRVLKRLSPQDELGDLEPGEPVRLPYDARDIPTIKHSYGEVPLVLAAAGVKRVVSFAYLVVWAWEEHKALSLLTKKPPQDKMVILIDEVESHLHPQWQRIFLPSLLDLAKDLSTELETQFIITTHSPLVTMSVEPIFNPEEDKLFHLQIEKQDLFGSAVRISEIPFIKYGPVDSWLTSDVFQLAQARSVEAEQAIEYAKKLQKMPNPNSEEVKELHRTLLNLLPSEDKFWPRWTYFAKSHGVEI